MFLPNPGILAAGVGGRTYDEFVAHITALATNGHVAWTEAFWSGTKKYRTTAGAFSGEMHGSPNQDRVANAEGYTTIARLIQHSLPNGDLSGAAIGQHIYFEVLGQGGAPILEGQTINGYTSRPTLEGWNVPSGIVPKIIWWSGGRAWWRNPWAATAPTPYDW